MTTPACPGYAGYRFPAEIISHAVWLYFRFPLSLRMVDELLAPRGIIVSYETVRQWAELAEGSARVASGMVNGGAQVGVPVAVEPKVRLSETPQLRDRARITASLDRLGL